MHYFDSRDVTLNSPSANKRREHLAVLCKTTCENKVRTSLHVQKWFTAVIVMQALYLQVWCGGKDDRKSQNTGLWKLAHFSLESVSFLSVRLNYANACTMLASWTHWDEWNVFDSLWNVVIFTLCEVESVLIHSVFVWIVIYIFTGHGP